jgi:Carboxypeptidase regulatory-like domain
LPFSAKILYVLIMITSARILIVVLVGVFASAASAYAEGATLRGQVSDSHGKPLPDAVIRVEGKEGSSKAKAVKTNPQGHYVSSGYGSGTFNIVLVMNGTVKAFIANVALEEGQTSTLNFELQGSKSVRPFTKGKHYVLAGAETGTNVGRWIEVDDKPTASAAAQTRSSAGGSNTMRRIQDTSGTNARQ